MSERLPQQAQGSECLRGKNDGLPVLPPVLSPTGAHRRKGGRLLPSDYLSHQKEKCEASDLQRQPCQDNNVTTETQVWKTFTSWCLRAAKHLSRPLPPRYTTLQGAACEGPRASGT